MMSAISDHITNMSEIVIIEVRIEYVCSGEVTGDRCFDHCPISRLWSVCLPPSCELMLLLKPRLGHRSLMNR